MSVDTAVINDFKLFLAGINLAKLVEKLFIVLLTVFLILVVVNLVQFILGTALKKRISEGQRHTLKKVLRYLGFVLVTLYVLKAIGINLTPILGAAGITGIVIGFAAQTSVSSIISGFFLLSEKAFSVGDVIKVDDLSGVVLSVDFLSVKLRTFDNLCVRIPNETIIKGNLITITRFPIRRLEISFSVSFNENLEKLKTLLLELAAENQYCLENPPPSFVIDKFSDSGISILFLVWSEASTLLDLKNSLFLAVKNRLENEGIKPLHKKIDLSVIYGNETGKTA
jgi:small-conductance mechanosensitive channel